YVPGSSHLIHNGNLLAARTYLLLGGDPEVAMGAVDATLALQLPDGSWPYGEGDGLTWIDNFHTAYVLMALSRMQHTFPHVSDALNAGVEFWLGRLFTGDGEPLYSLQTPKRVDV